MNDPTEFVPKTHIYSLKILLIALKFLSLH